SADWRTLWTGRCPCPPRGPAAHSRRSPHSPQLETPAAAPRSCPWDSAARRCRPGSPPGVYRTPPHRSAECPAAPAGCGC
ncbi:Helix-turn-helix transcriptional regulator, partial [Dysosmobacter welbionis]